MFVQSKLTKCTSWLEKTDSVHHWNMFPSFKALKFESSLILKVVTDWIFSQDEPHTTFCPTHASQRWRHNINGRRFEPFISWKRCWFHLLRVWFKCFCWLRSDRSSGSSGKTVSVLQCDRDVVANMNMTRRMELLFRRIALDETELPVTGWIIQFGFCVFPGLNCCTVQTHSIETHSKMIHCSRIQKKHSYLADLS